MKGGIFHNDEGISPVIGGVLILAISVTLLTTVQLNYVPVWNAQEELNHLEKVNDDFKELKSSIESSAVSGTVLSSPFSMGFKYSPKIIGYNPKESAYATMRINKDAWAEVRYNEVLPEGIDDATAIKNVSTSTITYSLYGTRNHSSFIYEHGLIRRSGSNYTASAQKLVVNDTLYLLSVNATSPESTSGLDRRTINVYPTSPAGNSVIGRNVWLILHTKPEYADWWESNIQAEGGIIKKKDSANGTLIVFFNKNLTIRMGETQIATTSRTAPPHSPQYRLVKVTPQNINLPIEGITTIEVEVQDFYNNPVPDVLVNFNANSSGTLVSNAYSKAELLQTSAISGADGRAKIQMRTHGPGIYYIDASIPAYTATFVYPASSQGGFITLSYTGSEPLYGITATLKNGFGMAYPPGEPISFSASEGTVSPLTDNTNAAGNASTVLDTAAAAGIKITNIRTGGINRSSATITWDTINTITVTANRTPGGYIFNFVDIPTNISTSGCIRYGTSPGNYPYITCDAQQRSTHNVSLSGLQAYTAYYFIVNSSRAGGGSINSSEYLFVTEPAAVDTTAPASITGLTNVTYVPLFINWTWTDPADADFAYVQVYIDGIFKSNVAKGALSYNGSYFMPNSTHTISTHTVDTSNNVNTTWVNHTAATTSILTYVYDLLTTDGTVTGFSSARNGSDGGESAIFTEAQVGGVNRSNRTQNPGKTITMGSQSGIYSSSSLDAVDGSIDITRALTEKQVKTVVYYMGQRESAADLAAGTNFTTEPVNVYLPEQGVVVRTAWLELWQLSGTTTAANVGTIDLFLNGVNYSVIKGGTYQSNSGESLITAAAANVTPAFSAFTSPTVFTAAVKTSAASNAQALMLYITYEYDPNSPTQLKTIRYPLDTKTGQIAAGTSTSFVYNVSIPGAATIRSSWFEVRGKVDSASTTDAVISARISTNATFSTGVSLDMALRDNLEFLYLFKTTPEFSINTPQTLIVRNQNQIVYTLGGEVVVTYEYSNAAPIQLKTVKYYVGQQTAIGGTTTLSGSTTVFIPEQGANVRSVWARVRTTYTSATASTQTVAGSIGGTAVASQAYTIDTNNELIGDYMIIYNMTSTTSSLVNNTVIFVNNTFSNTGHGPPATELYITYEYDPASPVEQKTVEYLAGQSAVQATTRNENFDIIVTESETTRRSAYIDYVTLSSAAVDYTTTSAIDTAFSSLTVNIDGTGEALTAGVLNNDTQNRITASTNTYDINYSSSANAAFSGVARLTYEFRKNNSLDVTYTFTETNSSALWQSVSIQDSSYGDALANASIFNIVSGRWEPVLTSAFAGGTTPATHVNTVVGAGGNASNYDSGGGQIKLRYNWTGAAVNNSLGVDMVNVTVFYSTGGVFRLNVTTNTTGIPDAGAQVLQLRYNVSNDNFTLQIWNGSEWNNRTTLNDTVMSYRNITLQPSELLSDGTMAGNAATINKYYMLVRYLDLNPGATPGRLYLDYQRVYSS